MNFTKITLATLIAAGAVFTSCSNNDDGIDQPPVGEPPVVDVFKELSDINITGLEVPTDYVFLKGNASTVSFTGQTTRLNQVNEIGDLLSKNDVAPTQADFTNRFNDAKGFTNVSLNGSKNVRSKTASSAGLFKNNLTDAVTIKSDFDAYLTNQIAVLESTEEAVSGVKGWYNNGSKTRYFNEKGLEYQQAFYKGLIGALTIDQTLNHYFNRLDDNFDNSNEYKNEHDAGTLATDKNYTTMEHHFDEAYGYVYGLASTEDRLLQKYINDVASQSNFSNIASTVSKAFKIGRAAIVAKNYAIRDAAVEVIRYQISQIPGARALYYLNQAKLKYADVNVDKREAFHALSEGYGFIYSLQFTYNTTTKKPYFTKTEVDGMITKLEAKNGFYDLTVKDLEDLSNTIVAKYDFTLAEALK